MNSATPLLRLVQAAARVGIDPVQVRNILRALVAPESLDDLPEVLGKFRRVLLVAEATWKVTLPTLLAAGIKWPGMASELEITSWPEVLEKLKPIAEQIGYPVTSADARHLGKPGDAGHRQRNALYSALLALPDSRSPYSARCELLMAHFFLAHYRLLCTPAGTKLQGGHVKLDTSVQAYEAYSGREPWPALTIQPKNCGLALRAYFSDEDWTHAVVASYPSHLPPEKFAAYGGLVFEGALLRYGKSQSWLEDLQDYLLYYLAQAWGRKPYRRGRGKRSEPLSGKALNAFRHDICPDEDEEDDSNELWGSSDAYLPASPARDSKQDRQGAAGRKGVKRPHSRTGNLAGAGSDQAIRASKFFPFWPDHPSPSDLVAIEIDGRRRLEEILTELTRATPSATESSEAPLISREQALTAEAELLLFVLIMLWTSGDIERTSGLRAYLTQTSHDRVPFAIVMPPQLEGSGAQIRIRVVFPADAPRRDVLPPHDRNRTEYVVLPDTAELGPLLWRLLALRDCHSLSSDQTGSIEIFDRPVDYYHEQVPRLLEKLSNRLTTSSLASVLYAEIMSWSQRDSSAATMITGDLRQGARVQMFYAVRRMRCLQEIYAGAVRYLRAAIALAHGRTGESGLGGPVSLVDLQRSGGVPAVYVPALDSDSYVGINACPRDTAMRDAVQSLIDAVECLWAGSRTNNWVEAHNLYTYYSVWFFGFVTGARPIVCPYLRPREIQEWTMCGRFMDKGKDRARLVWITDDLLAHMKSYEAYVDTTRLAPLTQYPCWLLDSEGAPEPVRKENCELMLHRFLPKFPTNIHRRWMFSALLDSGCPYVAEWAGHFLTGNRLVGRGATASPREVGRRILQYVQPIVSFLGFRPIRVKAR